MLAGKRAKLGIKLEPIKYKKKPVKKAFFIGQRL